MRLQNSDYKKHKAFSNPLRLQMMEHLNSPCTVKQVANKMGMRPHTLYHHIRVLEESGIVELVRHEKLKGSIEKKYFQLTEEYRGSAKPAPKVVNEGVYLAIEVIDDYLNSVESRPDLPSHAYESYVTINSKDAGKIQKKLNEGLKDLVEKVLMPFDRPDGDTTFILNTFGFVKKKVPSRKRVRTSSKN